MQFYDQTALGSSVLGKMTDVSCPKLRVSFVKYELKIDHCIFTYETVQLVVNFKSKHVLPRIYERLVRLRQAADIESRLIRCLNHAVRSFY